MPRPIEVRYHSTDPIIDYMPDRGMIYRRPSGLAIPLFAWNEVLRTLANQQTYTQKAETGEEHILWPKSPFKPAPIPLKELIASMEQAKLPTTLLNLSVLTTKIDPSPGAKVITVDRLHETAALNYWVSILTSPPRFNRDSVPKESHPSGPKKQVEEFDLKKFLRQHPLYPEHPPFSPPKLQVTRLAARVLDIVAPYTEDGRLIYKATVLELLMTDLDQTKRGYFEGLFPIWVRQLESGGVILHTFGQPPREVLAVTGHVRALHAYLKNLYQK